MVGATHSTSDDFDASGSGSQPPPPGFEELLATQNELLRQLVQGQQVITHFLQQQHFQLDGHQFHQPQVAGYQELNEDTQEIRDVYPDSLMPPSQLPMRLKNPQVKSRTRKYDPRDIDLTGWEITCKEFIPHGRRQTHNAMNANTVLQARTHSPVRENMDPARSNTRELFSRSGTNDIFTQQMAQ